MRRRGRWIAGIVVGILLLPVLLVVDVHRRAAITLDRHRAEVPSKWVGLQSRSAERSVVLGEPEDGNAWDLYRQAMKGLEKMTTDENDAIPEISKMGDPDRKADQATIAAIYRKYKTELDLLRRGTRRREVDPGFEPEPGLNRLQFGPSVHATRFLLGAMAHHHRHGAGREAMELGLCALVLGQDHGRRSFLFGAMVGRVMEEIALEGIRDVLAGHSLDGATLGFLAGSLDRVFAARPSMLEALDWEEVYIKKTILETTAWGEAFPFELELPRPGWRQVYSDQVMRAQAIGLISEWMRRVRQDGSGSFAERSRRLAEAAASGESFANPVAKAWYLGVPKSVTRADGMLLGYRLCRLSVALAWFHAEKGREAVSLEELVPRYIQSLPECPLSGTPFRYAPGKVWSVGKDGRDDGGIIDEAEGYNPYRKGTDAVWFVRRN